mgnify:CR=1 FL=1
MGNTSFILASIGVFLVVILLLVIILLVAKKYLSPSGNVNIVINGDKTINVPQGSSLMTTLNENGIFLPSACGGEGRGWGRCSRAAVRFSILRSLTSPASRLRTTGAWDASAR